ncbi:LutC/YkgG family protein [Nocardia mexicana]|uniref:LutC/YkgG family protein n=1 Tax=Nocardia mexicana TaxID=279262 RepID=UPI00147195B1|nr:LUD domain-containing protein [Nocardia mexicana]
MRDGLKSLPDDERTVPVPRHYRKEPREVSAADRSALVELFVQRLKHYGAQPVPAIEPDLADTVDTVLRAHGATSVTAPDGLPEEWLGRWAETDGHRIVADRARRFTGDLDRVDAVITTCAGADADSGTIVLDGGPGQTRRDSTLIPGFRLCVVRTDQIVSSLPEILDRLDSRRPITFIGGPSASVDRALSRDRGESDPRQLIVVIVE